MDKRNIPQEILRDETELKQKKVKGHKFATLLSKCSKGASGMNSET